MKIFRALLVLTLLVSPVFSSDYAVDTTFNHTFTINDIVYDAHLQGDGKLIVAGGVCQSFVENCTPVLWRLNTDGSRDMSFTVPIAKPGTSDGFVRAIEPLAGGKFFILGDFNIGTTRSQYARINADGSIDPTLPPFYLTSNFGSRDFAVMPDGRIVFCAERTINGELYRLAHRINTDGTPDPTFRVTVIPGGYCVGVEALASGKLMIATSSWSFEQPTRPLHRLNVDGTVDNTFGTPLPVGSFVSSLRVLPADRVLVGWGDNILPRPAKRFAPDGTLELDIPLCSEARFTPLSDGSLIGNGCKRWQYHYGTPIQFARVYADGSVDQRIDNIRFDENTSGGVFGVIEAGNERFYVYGGYGAVQGDYTRRKLVRLSPNTAGKRAKYDFDGDGRSDIAVYRPSEGIWYLNQSTAGIAYKYWGLSTDKISAAHWDNDGKTDVTVFRDGTWHGVQSLSNAWRPIQIGAAGDKPMPGDFDDMGPTLQDQAVRGVRSGVAKWYIREGQYVIHGGPWNSPEYTLPGELPSDKPVVADFSGDSRDEFGYFRDGYWYTVDFRAHAPEQTFQWGTAGDIPVPADYDGDRQDDYAVYRPSTGVWWINRSSAGAIAVKFGISTDIPVPADYDGDGKTDLAIYRDGQWWQFLSSTGSFRVENWGTANDRPIPAQAQ